MLLHSSIPLLTVLMFLAASSHAGICTGVALGTGVINRRNAIIIYAVFSFLGMILQGGFMKKALLYPSICSLTTTTALMVMPTLTGIPLSLNFALYTSQIGCKLGTHALVQDLLKLITTLCLWILALCLTIALSYILGRVWIDYLAKHIRNPWKALSCMKALILILSASYSFTVGANTFGYILSFLEVTTEHRYAGGLLICIAFALGAALFSSKSLARVAYRFYMLRPSQALISLLSSCIVVEGATVISLPVSASLVTVTALYFVGLASKIKVINTSNYLAYVLTQLLSIPIAIVIALIFSNLIFC